MHVHCIILHVHVHTIQQACAYTSIYIYIMYRTCIHHYSRHVHMYMYIIIHQYKSTLCTQHVIQITEGMYTIIHQYTSTSCMQHVYIVTAGMYIHVIIHQYKSTSCTCTQHVIQHYRRHVYNYTSIYIYIMYTTCIHRYSRHVHNYTSIYMYTIQFYIHVLYIYVLYSRHLHHQYTSYTCKCTYCTCIIQLDVHVHNTLYIKNMYMNGTMYKTATCK